MKEPAGPREFATTRWSLVLAARPGDASEATARRALAELCRTYWYPLYAFVRHRGYSADDAQDLTQSFFVRVVEAGGFPSADPERGRFRSYLLGAMKHFLANEWDRVRARKRGGGLAFVAWDGLGPEERFAATPRQSLAPEVLFDREWAVQTVAGALEALRDEMARAGRGGLYEALKGTLSGEDEAPRAELAARLGMTEGAVKVAVHRLRRRYREILRAAIAATVASDAACDDEMRYLVEVLRGR